MDLLIMIFGTVRNYFRAQNRRLNAARWALFTFLSMFGATTLGFLVLAIIILRRNPAIMGLAGDQKRLQEALFHPLTGSVMPQLFIVVCSIGGYLFIRHRIDRQPPGPPPLVPED